MNKKLDSVIFATFSVRNKGERTAINGMIEPFTKVFLPRTKRLVLIDQPHPGCESVIPFLEIYEKGKPKKESRYFLTSFLLYPLLKLINTPQTQILFKIRDFLSIFEYVLLDKNKHELFIGLESINALAGIILKKLGLVEKVVYYVSDFSPQRYKPKWFNDLYLWLDRQAAMHSDYIWDVSLAMMPSRIKAGLDPKLSAPLIHVPNALFPEQIAYLPLSKTTPNSLVFVGTLGKINGPDLAIKTLKIILKTIKNTSLHIFGDGEPDFTRLKKLTTKLKLEKYIIFHGFISDQIKLSKETSKYQIGLAPYIATPGSPRWWADATKTRLYLAAGLPVVTTQVPPLGKEIEKDGAGIIAKDTPQEQATAVIKLLTDKVYYAKMRQKAIKRAKNNTWENTYTNALEKMGFK